MAATVTHYNMTPPWVGFISLSFYKNECIQWFCKSKCTHKNTLENDVKLYKSI